MENLGVVWWGEHRRDQNPEGSEHPPAGFHIVRCGVGHLAICRSAISAIFPRTYASSSRVGLLLSRTRYPVALFLVLVLRFLACRRDTHGSGLPSPPEEIGVRPPTQCTERGHVCLWDTTSKVRALLRSPCSGCTPSSSQVPVVRLDHVLLHAASYIRFLATLLNS